jgi:ubiquinone biosynthesis protein COQ9
MTPAALDDALKQAIKDGFSAALVEHWSAVVDAAMTARLGQLALAERPVRERIRTAVLTRLAILEPHKLAARKAALFLASPLQAPLAMRLLAATVDRMWQAAGDRASDFNWYSKRFSLAAVYTATEIAWFGDDTPGAITTARFLDARIENVLQYEKLKGRVLRACQPTRTS